VRIIAGAFRGHRLTAVGKGDTGAHLRPTTDRVRESLFNVLAGGRFGDPFDGSCVLDLFAGTGALGLESLSRGATHVTFVDDGRVAGRLIRENLKLLDCNNQARLLTRDATRLPACDTPCDLIFLDPPYSKDLGARALASARAGGWVAPDALVVWEEAAAQDPPKGFTREEARRYGDSWITILRAD